MIARILFLLFIALPAWAAPRTYGDVAVSRVVSIYDGDTFYVDVDNWPAIVGDRVSVRIYGIDTPEMRGGTQAKRAAARRAREFVATRFAQSRVVTLVDLRRDKYFRLNARVLVDGVDLGAALIAARLAVAYDGGTKTP
jgi:micrococcal nuclease